MALVMDAAGPVARLRDRLPGWLIDLIVVLVLEALVLILTIEVLAPLQADKRLLDPIGYALLVVGLGSMAVLRWPYLAYGAALVTNLIYFAMDYPNTALPEVLLVALYLVARHKDGKRALILTLLAVGAFVGANTAFNNHGLSNHLPFAGPGWAGAALFLGRSAANRVRYLTEVEARALRAERTQKAETRRQVAEERLRIARELHDVISHTMAMISVQSGVAGHLIDDRPDQAKQALLAINSASREALREVRAMLGVLRASNGSDIGTAPTGLSQLDVLVSTASHAGLPVRVRTDGTPQPLPGPVDVTAYRIVQESLTNALRHAGPAQATITLAYHDDHLLLEIADNGRGPTHSIDPRDPSVDPGSGHGLEGMRERATAVGGVLEAGPRPGGGFQVRARLPVSGAPMREPAP